MEQIVRERTNHRSHRSMGLMQPDEARGKFHACKASQRNLELAQDRLKRANRDLGETAALVLASLTTATAIEAVINMAVKQIGISPEFLKTAFYLYIAVFILIFAWGAFRSGGAMRRRAGAEREIELAKKGIFEFCVDPQIPAEEE
jgi:hypothetical protein